MAGSARRILIPFLILAAVGVAVFLYSRYAPKPPAEIRVTGTVDGVEVNLSPKVAGRIASIACREGDAVRAGQRLVVLESDDVRASVAQASAAVARARADVAAAAASTGSADAAILGTEADIRSAEADQAKAKAQLEESRRESGRRRTLVDSGLIAREEYEQSALAADVNAASLDSTRERLAAARTRREAAVAERNAATQRVEAAKAALGEATAGLAFYRSKAADTAIVSPVSGTVIFKAMEAGETVSPGATILTIVDTGSLYVRADVDESRIGGIALNRRAEISVEGLPGRKFEGVVSEIGRRGEFATQRDVVRGREDIKTFRVKVRFDDPSGTLKPGMTVELRIPTGP